MKTARILIVDDKVENAYLLRTILESHGFKVVTAVHGIDALEKARQKPPDMIISDVLMPVMDGFALCTEWKKDPRLNKIPFMFYTATYTDDHDREFGLKLGAEQFVVKPVEPEAFIATVNKTLRQPASTPVIQNNTAKNTLARFPAISPEEDEFVFLKQYNEVLIRKLEAKMEQLENVNRDLMRDIAERKLAEESLKKSEEKYRVLVENAIDNIFMIDKEYKVLSINKATSRLLGKEEKDIVGKQLAEVFPRAIAEINIMNLEKVFKNGKALSVEGRVSVNDREFWTSTTLNPIKGDDGKVHAVLGFNRDITERKKMEIALRANEENLRLLYQALPFGILSTDKDSSILYANKAAEEITGVKMMAMIGKQVPFERLEFVSKEGEPLKFEMLPSQLSVRSKKPVLNLILGFSHGVTRERGWLSVNAVPILGSSIQTIFTCVMTFEDITSRVMYEKMILKKQQNLIASDQSIKDFSAKLLFTREEEKRKIAVDIHDEAGLLAITLGALLGNLEADIRDKNTKEALALVKRSRNDLKKSVLKLKRIAVMLRPPNIDIMGFEGAIKEYSDYIMRFFKINISLDIRLPENLKLSDVVVITLYRIYQEALNNVITHAKAKNVRVRLDVDGKDVVFSVADDGKGFTEKELENPRGFGIGVKGMRERIEFIGGKFILDSVVGKGTVAKVNISKIRANKQMGV